MNRHQEEVCQKLGIDWETFDLIMEKLGGILQRKDLLEKYLALKRNSDMGDNCYYAGIAANMLVTHGTFDELKELIVGLKELTEETRPQTGEVEGGEEDTETQAVPGHLSL